jgi:Tfp pilus assembly protein PilF
MLKLGIAYTKKGLYSKAIGQFNMVISVKRNEHAAYLHRGRAYQALGDVNKAMLDYNTACYLGNKDGCRALPREHKANQRGMPERPQ